MRVHNVKVSHDLQPADLLGIVQAANRYRSSIQFILEESSMVLDAKSMLGMMLRPIRSGTILRIQTRGGDEEEALDEMCRLLEKSLGA
ncbi:HPr family phosphocarrier protein [Paenibacillus filicis]|uniref:HPr family phosphocarrier protein n=1 Tax=Paenibacillus gyeongsangnamensis TaxID=3388067 RepID=A0ABT4Q664_9BACL|nr:HPr family phosphocarrier protein [Paenibacillus filicis]MCZ8512272.1 HPr family phosphocarrier protein [Paenibacillus filicis]